LSPFPRRRDLVRGLARSAPIVLVAALAFAVLGAPAALLLVGAWSCSQALASVLPRLGTPAAWAGGVVAVAGVVLTASAVIAASGVGGDVTAPQIVALLMPTVIGLGVAIPLRLRGRVPVHARADRTDGRVAAAGAAIILAVVGLMKTEGVGSALAWAMGGDARNHTFILRRILEVGGISLDELQTYPAASNALAAVIAGSGERAGLNPGQLVAHDVGSIANVYVLAVIAAFVLIIAVLRQSSPNTAAHVFVPVSFIAGSMVTSALVLGTTLSDGFFSAYATIPLVIAAVALAFRALTPDPGGRAAMVALAPTTVLVFASWTLLVVIPAGLVLALSALAVLRALRPRPATDGGHHPWLDVVVAAIPFVVTAALAIVSLANLERLSATFALTGAIVSPDPFVAVGLGLALIGTFGLAGSVEARLRTGLLLVAAVTGAIAVLWLLTLPGPGLTWSYYPTKTLWLIVSSLIWVPFVPLLGIHSDPVASEPAVEQIATDRRRIAAGVAATSLALAVSTGLSLGTEAPNPLAAVTGDWTQPSAEIIDATVAQADDLDPFVFWEWSDPGNDRLGNFWAALAWSVDSSGVFLPAPDNLPGGVTLWAYFATGSIESLCDLSDGYPELTVVTRSTDLEEAALACDEDVAVEIDRD
jgi:hypothetical protein